MDALEFCPVSIEDARQTLDQGTCDTPSVFKAPETWHRRTGTSQQNRLSPAVESWLLALPAGIRPLKCAHYYPRVVNALYAVWTDPVALGALLDELVLSQRRNRAGFPFGIALELDALRTDQIGASRDHPV